MCRRGIIEAQIDLPPQSQVGIVLMHDDIYVRYFIMPRQIYSSRVCGVVNKLDIIFPCCIVMDRPHEVVNGCNRQYFGRVRIVKSLIQAFPGFIKSCPCYFVSMKNRPEIKIIKPYPLTQEAVANSKCQKENIVL